MVTHHKLRKGLDIALTGSPRQSIAPGPKVSRVALAGLPFPEFRPAVLVEQGQQVHCGDALLQDKRHPNIKFTAPGSGTVVDIIRGHRRVLDSIVIELDESIEAQEFTLPAKFNGQSLRELLLQSGAWTGLRTRPFGRVPNPNETPQALFITAIDTRPLCADPKVVIDHFQDAFVRGVELLSQLAEAPTYLCTGADWAMPELALSGLTRVSFAGPHPAGLPGTHIHLLHPVSRQRQVWHIDYEQVIAIGHLASTGRLLTERVVALGGAGLRDPRLVLTRAGASLTDLLAGELSRETGVRVISGSVLDGDVAPYLAMDHKQVSVLASERDAGFLDWVQGMLPGRRGAGEDSDAQHGRRCALLPSEAFERALPLDILPTPLLRALLIDDVDSAEALGCLELAPEDLALCTYLCPSKQDYPEALRRNLLLIEAEG